MPFLFMIQTTTRIISTIPRFVWVRHICNSAEVVNVSFKNGHPIVTVPLHRLNSKMHFTVSNSIITISDFGKAVRKEDECIETVAFFDSDGIPFASDCAIADVIRSALSLRLNNVPLRIMLEKDGDVDSRLIQLKALIDQVHAALNSKEERLLQEQAVNEKLKIVAHQLEPLELQKSELIKRSNKWTNRMLWIGLASMGFLTGFLARLVWYEYSWDIMEPVTYFVTYSAALGGFAYYILTRQQYEYPLATQRIFDVKFHKLAQKSGFDLHKYSKLKSELNSLERQLTTMKQSSLQPPRNAVSIEHDQK